MSNVKPGDFAKIIAVASPELAVNVGTVVYVLGPLKAKDFLEMDYPPGAIVWEIDILSLAKFGFKGEPLQIAYPGQRAACDDKYLRRVDPPEDWKELYSTEDKREPVIVR